MFKIRLRKCAVTLVVRMNKASRALLKMHPNAGPFTQKSIFDKNYMI